VILTIPLSDIAIDLFMFISLFPLYPTPQFFKRWNVNRRMPVRFGFYQRGHFSSPTGQFLQPFRVAGTDGQSTGGGIIRMVDHPRAISADCLKMFFSHLNPPCPVSPGSGWLPPRGDGGGLDYLITNPLCERMPYSFIIHFPSSPGSAGLYYRRTHFRVLVNSERLMRISFPLQSGRGKDTPLANDRFADVRIGDRRMAEAEVLYYDCLSQGNRASVYDKLTFRAFDFHFFSPFLPPAIPGMAVVPAGSGVGFSPQRSPLAGDVKF